MGGPRGRAPEGIQGARRMPRRREPTKGAASRESPGGAAHGLRSRGARMGEPGRRGPSTAPSAGATGGTETSKYPEERKSNRDPPSSGERTGASPNRATCKLAGVARAGLRARCPGAANPGGGHKARAQRKTHGKARGTGLEPRTREHVPSERGPEYRRARGTRREAGGTAPQG